MSRCILITAGGDLYRVFAIPMTGQECDVVDVLEPAIWFGIGYPGVAAEIFPFSSGFSSGIEGAIAYSYYCEKLGGAYRPGSGGFHEKVCCVGLYVLAELLGREAFGAPLSLDQCGLEEGWQRQLASDSAISQTPPDLIIKASIEQITDPKKRQAFDAAIRPHMSTRRSRFIRGRELERAVPVPSDLAQK